MGRMVGGEKKGGERSMWRMVRDEKRWGEESECKGRGQKRERESGTWVQGLNSSTQG